jgi:hypothetical protein
MGPSSSVLKLTKKFGSGEEEGDDGEVQETVSERRGERELKSGRAATCERNLFVDFPISTSSATKGLLEKKKKIFFNNNNNNKNAYILKV